MQYRVPLFLTVYSLFNGITFKIYELLVALRRFHASSGKIYVYYLISISLKLRKKTIIAHFLPTFNAVSGTTILNCLCIV